MQAPGTAHSFQGIDPGKFCSSEEHILARHYCAVVVASAHYSFARYPPGVDSRGLSLEDVGERQAPQEELWGNGARWRSQTSSTCALPAKDTLQLGDVLLREGSGFARPNVVYVRSYLD